MIITLKRNCTDQQKQEILSHIKQLGYEAHTDTGVATIIGIRGDVSKLSEKTFQALEGVEDAKRISKPYKEASVEFKSSPTIIDVRGVKIGGGHKVIIAGPCSVENEEQVLSTAMAVKAAGATMLRGGAFKPRTSPYAFQGHGEEGMKLLDLARKKTGLPIVTEIMGVEQMPLFEKYDVDVYQIGARNMQNFNLLRELGKINKPMILKRGPSATVEEWLLSAEYLLAHGNKQVILCERGIRTFETAYRNVLDLNAVVKAKMLTHLPIIVDPSHGTGLVDMVRPMGLAGLACGSDGLIIEVHPNRKVALSDAAQQLSFKEFEEFMQKAKNFL